MEQFVPVTRPCLVTSVTFFSLSKGLATFNELFLKLADMTPKNGLDVVNNF